VFYHSIAIAWEGFIPRYNQISLWHPLSSFCGAILRKIIPWHACKNATHIGYLSSPSLTTTQHIAHIVYSITSFESKKKCDVMKLQRERYLAWEITESA
jgi:fibrillarin-like rRNA methylase